VDNNSSGQYDLLDQLTEEFAERCRRGERPSVKEYIDRYPHLEGDLRAILPAVVEIEQVEQGQRAAAVPAPSGADPPPARVGDYRILRELGRGGMGVVYEAEQQSLGRRVALKVLSNQALGDGTGQERFRREARSAARLHHTNIVPVFDVGQEGNTSYYAMQLIEGQGLDQVIRELRQAHDPNPRGGPPTRRSAQTQGADARRPGGMSQVAQSLLAGCFEPPSLALATPPTRPPGVAPAGDRTTDARPAAPVNGSAAPPANASTSPAALPERPKLFRAGPDRRQYFRSVARVGQQTALALAHAHARGIVHRDIKPSNLLLDASGVVWVTDFGLAKTEDHGLTRTGELPGTLRYMSPERFHGECDARADVYALGLTLYEMLGLRPAFDAGDNLRLIEQISHQEPPRPRSLDPQIPRDLETVVLRAIEKDPRRRYPSADELAEDLRLFLEDKPPRARRVGRLERLGRWCRRNPTVAAATSLAAAALLAVSVVSALWTVRAGADAKAVAEARDRAEYRLAENHLDRGLGLCDRGEIGVGLLWLVRSLQTAPASAAPVQATARAQLGGWARHVIPLKACLESPAPITAAALSPKGNAVWAATKDGGKGVLWRWDVAHPQPRGPALRLEAPVDAILWDPEGNVVVTVDRDGTVQRWDAAACASLGPPLPHKAISARWSLDGQVQVLVTAGADGNVRFWDPNTGAPRGAGIRLGSKVRAFAISPDAKTILTMDGEATRFWDAHTGTALGEPLPHRRARSDFVAAALSPDGATLLTACDRTTRRWQAATRKPLGDSRDHKATVVALAFSPDGRTFVTGGHDRTARLWDSATGEAVGQPLPHEAEVNTVAFSADGRTLLTAAPAKTLRIWEVPPERPLGRLLPHGSTVRAVAFHPAGVPALTAGYDGAVRFWDPANGKPLAGALRQPSPIMAATFSRDGRRVLTQCWGNTVWLWDAETGQQVCPPMRHPTRVNSAALSPDAGTVLTGCKDGSVRFWDVGTGAIRGPAPAHRGPVLAAAFSPDGRTAATAGNDGTALRWDVATGQPRGPVLPHGGAVLCLSFGSDGSTLLTGSADHGARLWDAAGNLLGPVMLHGNAVTAVAFSPQGRTLLLTASDDGTARLWDATTRAPLGPPLEHHDHVACAAFSPDGRSVLTGSWDRTARQWDVATGKPLGPPMTHGGFVWAVAFSPDGQSVLTGSADGTAKSWQVPRSAAGTAEHMALELEVLTGVSLDENDVVRVLAAADWQDRRRRVEEFGFSLLP
jgi:WD40 repeat protein/serine/threonine protein kinase